MDKKNFVLGTLFILAAAACYYISYRYGPKPETPEPAEAVAQPAPTEAAPGAPPAGQPEFVAVAPDAVGSTLTTLQNDDVAVHFTNFGGAIHDVALKQFPATLGSAEPFDFNAGDKGQPSPPALFGFADLPGLDRNARYHVVRKTDTEIDYQATLEGRVQVTRRYILSPISGADADPYLLRVETTFRNLGATPYTVPGSEVQVALGTAGVVNSQDVGLQLMAWYDRAGKGGGVGSVARSKLQQSNGFIGIGAHPLQPDIPEDGPLAWAGVSNQFFASVYTPDQPAAGVVIRRVKLDPAEPDSEANAYGITADAQLAVPTIPAHGSVTLGGSLYVGPKEYHLLANPDVFHADQDRVMDFGLFRWFAALLLTLMTWMHSCVANWGVAIILTTFLLKVCFLPFTLAASRSARRMQKIQPELKALREKYKDNPQKQQAAQIELFKKHRVNPAGGCLPMIVTIPFFWGFFAVLRNSAELRFAHFLWAKDLTVPDTVGHLFGVPVNVLPLLLGLVMFLQMHFTPQPTVDSSQQNVMKFMPLIFVVFYYNWSCALSLYSTVNALTSMAQQWIVNHTKEPEPAAQAAAHGGRALKNVTPRRR